VGKLVDNERQRLLHEYLEQHQKTLSLKILNIAFIYLFLSISWNLIFDWFGLEYSRADVIFLIGSFIWLLIIMIYDRFRSIPTGAMPHIILLYVIGVVCSLYFGSGYYEAWAFFLLIPLLTGLYGKRRIMLGYISIGLAAMVYLSLYYPLNYQNIDLIDVSNRVLLYVIIATFSFILVNQLLKLFNNQVNIIVESSDTTIEQVVKSFILSVEAKDTYTFGHSERVSLYAVELAKLLPEFVNKQRLKSLGLAGLLHDIGKINIPESVLTKSTELTLEEYELIKTHPVAGGKMVDKIPSLGTLKNGVLYHHERWDGKGYPAGISEEEIPLEARILNIADAFDAMTSNRAYRDALSFNEAYERLYQGSGTQFDPNLIELIGKVQIAWKKIYNTYNDEIMEIERLTDLL
jgi:HD-GYP domain-containing protein (c-di-GMP phosphodiesterase class II)